MPKRKGRKPGPKPGRKANVPFTVAIHGRGIDIDAAFSSDTDVLDKLGELLNNVRIGNADNSPPPTAGDSTDDSGDIEAIAAYIGTASDETLSTAYELVGAEIDRRAVKNGATTEQQPAQA